MYSVFSPGISFKMVHNEIHNIRKPREALPSQVFQVVAIKAKGIFGFQTRPQRAYWKLVSCPDPTHVREGLVTQVQILGPASEFESIQ